MASASHEWEPTTRTFTRRIGEQELFRIIELSDGFVTVTSGEVGMPGNRRSQPFADQERATTEHATLIRQTLAEGYQEETAPYPPSPLQQALEEAIVADPDDRAGHMAYADFLSEQTDPARRARGEFIRAEMVLDDPSVPYGERARQVAREYRPLEVHLRQWLGELAPFLIAGPESYQSGQEPRYCYRFNQGWLGSIEATRFDCAFTKTLAHAPEARLLRHLMLVAPIEDAPEGDLEPPDAPAGCLAPAIYWLVDSPYLKNVQMLTLGSGQRSNRANPAAGVVALVRSLPRLERLYLAVHDLDMDALFSLSLSSLRELNIACQGRWSLDCLPNNPSLVRLEDLVIEPPVTIDQHRRAGARENPVSMKVLRGLARSPHLKSLHRLTLRRTPIGDDGVREIVASGLLGRLQYLSLRSGTVTDEGARALANCPEVARLEHLDLEYNCLTARGIEMLKPHANVATGNQRRPTGNPDEDYRALSGRDLE